MRTLGILALCFTLSCARTVAQEPADDPRADTLQDCGAEKVAIFAGTTSKDAHFALAWTLRPNRKKTPVDWSTYKRDEPMAIMEKFPISDEDPTAGDYILVNGVLDLTAKRFTVLPIEDPHFPGRNHHGIAATWSEDRQGTRFAVVGNDGRFATNQLFLVHVTPQHVQPIPLSPTADKAVADRMRKRDPKDYRNYETAYELGSDPAPASKTPSGFQKNSVTIRFYTGIPKDDVNNDAGTITFTLPKGTILGVAFEKK